jgi:thioesterase domain-containing protein
MYRVQELADYEFTGYKDHPQLTSAAFGWDELCKSQVLVRFVPGTHISMIFQPNVQVLTEKFQADLHHCIAAARTLSPRAANG